MVAPLARIEIADDPEVARDIEQRLRVSLSRINRQAANHSRIFCLRDEQGRLIAGLTCSTAYGWLHIETLWVDESLRGRGVGRRLMNAAEAFGRDNACHSAWLDTSSSGACAFYRKLGYDVFGELTNGQGQFPAEHRRWFLRREL